MLLNVHRIVVFLETHRFLTADGHRLPDDRTAPGTLDVIGDVVETAWNLALPDRRKDTVRVLVNGGHVIKDVSAFRRCLPPAGGHARERSLVAERPRHLVHAVDALLDIAVAREP